MFAGFIAACSFTAVDIKTLAEDFATLECKAVQLRKDRFALADVMRFSEDTLIMSKDDSITQRRINTRLKVCEEQKKILVKNSLDLADTIRVRLDSLMKNELASVEKRKLFDAELEKVLKERGCK